jgi:hypothetical protein
MATQQIPGISSKDNEISVIPPLAGATASIASEPGGFLVTLNGQSVSVPQGTGLHRLDTLNFKGQGKDNFTNSTSLQAQFICNGGGTVVNGGTGVSAVEFYGGGNTFNPQPNTRSDVNSHGGTDTIGTAPGATVTHNP